MSQKDLKKLAKRESLFATLAKKEGKGARQRARIESKAGLKESANDSRWEAMEDKKFAKVRQKKALAAKSRIKNG